MFKKIVSMMFVLSLLFVIAACTETDNTDSTVTDPVVTTEPADTVVPSDPTDTVVPTEEVKTIVEIAVESGNFGTLVAALTVANLVTALSAEGPFTVFAPSEAAFAELLETLDLTASELLALENLSEILTYHVVAGQFLAADVIAAAPFEAVTLNGESISVTVVGGNVMVNDAMVTSTNILGSNGVIHVIDKVLLPPVEEEPLTLNILQTAIATEGFSTLVAAVISADLVAALIAVGPFTVFAPTDQAFEDLLDLLEVTKENLLTNSLLLQEVLLYHVVAGQFSAADVIALAANGPAHIMTLGGAMITISVVDGKVFINDAEVILADVFATNGVIHVIDAVLLPPVDEEPILLNIVETAIATEGFSTLVAAIVAAGLVDALIQEGPFTVFTPNDLAFANLLNDLDLTLADILEDTETLAEVLLYHVVAGQFSAADVIALTANGPVEVETLGGVMITIYVVEGMVYINDSVVILADVFATNGVIHVIDSVLLPFDDEEPELLNIVETAIFTEGFSTLVAAIIAAGLVEALIQEGPFTVFAPNDQAFADLLALLDLTPEELLSDTELLTSVLLYHVVEGQFSAADVIALTANGPVEVETLGGAMITISVVNGKVFVNDAEVILADVFSTNGVIHAIDAVLLPPVQPLELTLAELAMYNGLNGNRAYIAVSGIIYDVTDSPLWPNGNHNGYQAGQDLTNQILNVSPHGLSTLSGIPIVGVLVTSK